MRTVLILNNCSFDCTWRISRENERTLEPGFWNSQVSLPSIFRVKFSLLEWFDRHNLNDKIEWHIYAVVLYVTNFLYLDFVIGFESTRSHLACLECAMVWWFCEMRCLTCLPPPPNRALKYRELPERLLKSEIEVILTNLVIFISRLMKGFWFKCKKIWKNIFFVFGRACVFLLTRKKCRTLRCTFVSDLKYRFQKTRNVDPTLWLGIKRGDKNEVGINFLDFQKNCLYLFE